MPKFNKKSSSFIPCITIIVFIALLWWWIYYLYKNNFFRSKQRDLFTTMKPNIQNAGAYPYEDMEPLLNKDYPLSGRKGVSNDNYSQIWWYYPVLPLGSYEQITNNLRYFKNPDIGQCVRADMCGALYKDKKVKSNVSKQLPPVKNGPGARIGYFRGKYNLLI